MTPNSNIAIIGVSDRRLSQRKAVRARHRGCRGLSILELLLALAITAMLLTAAAAAIAASFRAYGDAVEQASTQVSVRMISQRLLGLIRTSTAHGPLEADSGATPPVTIDDQIITSNYIEVLDTKGRVLRCEYRAEAEELWLILNPDETDEQAQPLISGVTNAQFMLRRWLNDDGIWELERCTIDVTVQPDEDTTLALENGPAQAVRVVASTMPRKLE